MHLELGAGFTERQLIYLERADNNVELTTHIIPTPSILPASPKSL